MSLFGKKLLEKAKFQKTTLSLKQIFDDAWTKRVDGMCENDGQTTGRWQVW